MTGVHDIFTMVPMSTPAVFGQTCEVISERGLSLQILNSDFDVDLPEDLPRLTERIAQDAVLSQGHTARVLRGQPACRLMGESSIQPLRAPGAGRSIFEEERCMAQPEQTSDVTVLIRSLSDRIVEVLEQLSTLSDDELDAPCAHPCATAGTVRSLLTHNIDHERMHIGQVYNIRYEAKIMQNGETARLLAEWLRDRAMLISSLYGLSDNDLDRRHTEGEYSIRECVEHVLYWEKDSVEGLLLERAAARSESELMLHA
jgi:uncharacterized damage-inducible protein DinB